MTWKYAYFPECWREAESLRQCFASANSLSVAQMEVAATYSAVEPSKPRSYRRLTLTKVDRRSRMGKRIAELRAIFIAALGGEQALSAMKRLKVDDAAQLKAVAELARGDYMRGGDGSLDDIVRVERKAERAVRALGIVETPREKAPSLSAILAEKRGGA